VLAGLIGALSATGATFGITRLRKQLTENTAVHDAVIVAGGFARFRHRLLPGKHEEPKTHSFKEIKNHGKTNK
jgi:hypothetical protein